MAGGKRGGKLLIDHIALVQALQAHALGMQEMSGSQIQAAQLLLSKSKELPSVRAVGTGEQEGTYGEVSPRSIEIVIRSEK